MYQGLVVHHIPGRLRVRLPFLKGFSSSPEQIRELMSPLPGIKQVDFNPMTGSAVITYDAQNYESFLDQLAEYAQLLGLTIKAPESATNNNHKGTDIISQNGQSDLSRLLVSSFKRLNAEVSKASQNGVDLKSLLPVGIATYALFKIGSAATTPLWVTLGLFSFASFVSLNPGALDESVEQEQRKKRRPKRMSNNRLNKSS